MRQTKYSTSRKSVAAAALLSTLGLMVKDLQGYPESTGETPYPNARSGRDSAVKPVYSRGHSDRKRPAASAESEHLSKKRKVLVPDVEALFNGTQGSGALSLVAPTQHATIKVLPIELLCLVGDDLDVEEIYPLTSVCQLFRDIFFPLYLIRRGFPAGRMYVNLQSSQAFKSFQSFHRSRALPSGAYLSATFSGEVNPDNEARAVTYALSHLPPRTFTTISLTFSRCHPTGARSLAHLFAALASSHCTYLDVSSCFVREDIVDIPEPTLPIAPWPMDQLILDGGLNHPLFPLLVLKASRSLENISLTRSPITVPNQASSVQTWDRFLNAKPFPQLTALQISEDLPPRQLLDFISRHPHLSRLSIAPEAGHSHIMHGIPRLYDLASLTVISGPPSYVLAILRNASHRPSLERLSLLVDDIPPPPSSIIPAITPCLALCQQVETLEVTIPDQDCQAMFNGIALKFDKNPNVKILRISSTKFSLDPPIQDAVIIALWREWRQRLPTIEHLQFDQASQYHDRKNLFETACEEFPALAVSVRWGSYLKENQLAVGSGGFDWHVL